MARLAAQLTGRTWRDKDGTERSMEPTDILIVTPYNAQIRAIQTALTASGQTGFRVGTVDKFQGQEAPVVIYSMATSSADEAPRGLEFLYDPHRLNVATSRARALAIIVASPDLIRVSCRTPHQMSPGERPVPGLGDGRLRRLRAAGRALHCGADRQAVLPEARSWSR